jgi:two-component system response regulator EvgA
LATCDIVSVNVIIAEDYLLFREVLRKLCIQEFGYNVVAETDSGREALNLIAEHRPDLVLLDFGGAEKHGLQVIEHMANIGKKPLFLIITSNCTEYVIYRLIKAGISGLIDKATADIAVMKAAISAVTNHRTYYSSRIAAIAAALVTKDNSFNKILSDHEQAILGLISRGLADDEIGSRLAISTRTAQTHRSNIMRKLGVKTHAKLVAFANEKGFWGPIW